MRHTILGTMQNGTWQKLLMSLRNLNLFINFLLSTKLSITNSHKRLWGLGIKTNNEVI